MSEQSPPRRGARLTGSEFPRPGDLLPPARAPGPDVPDVREDQSPSLHDTRDTLRDVSLVGEGGGDDATTRHERPGRRAPRSVSAEFPALVRLESRYRDTGQIGRGGMSAIHCADDSVVGRRVAVKLFRTSGPTSEEDEARFVEEARITGQLEHPNIVPIHDLSLETGDQPPYFTMKLVRGRTLTEMIREHACDALTHKQLDVLLEVFLRVCDAIAYAHTRCVVHRDLKPENVMVGSHGQVYVMDWGVARVLPRAARDAEGVMLAAPALRDERGSIIGTMIYMSPEQALGLTDEVDERTDVFGLGAILYAILSARPLYVGRTHIDVLNLAREGRILPPEVAAPHRTTPPELSRIALKATAARPADRYQSVEALQEEVAEFRRSGGWFPSRFFPGGTLIVAEGARGDDAFIIEEGICEVIKTDRGVSRGIKRLGPGDVFGEAAVFNARPRTASVVAVTDVVAKVVTREALQHEMAGRDWLRAFFEALADRFIALDGELTQLRSGSD